MALSPFKQVYAKRGWEGRFGVLQDFVALPSEVSHSLKALRPIDPPSLPESYLDEVKTKLEEARDAFPRGVQCRVHSAISLKPNLASRIKIIILC